MINLQMTCSIKAVDEEMLQMYEILHRRARNTLQVENIKLNLDIDHKNLIGDRTRVRISI